MFYEKVSTFEGLTAQYIQQNVAKGLYHSLTKEDLFDKYGNLPPDHPQYAHFRDYIPRSGSASSVVVEGVKKGEDPNMATLWSNVGFPLASVMVPTWVGEEPLPEIVRYHNDLKDSPVCHAALQLKKQKIMNLRWGKSDHYYINVNALSNNKDTGITQITKRYEMEIYKKTYDLLKKWETEGTRHPKDVKKMYQWVNNYIKEAYLKEFGIKL